MDKERKIVFISIPITGRDVQEAKQHCFDVRRTELREYGLVLSPFDMKGWEMGMPWEWYMVRTLSMLQMCNSIYMCKGWRESRGCRFEREFAKYHGMDIIYE